MKRLGYFVVFFATAGLADDELHASDYMVKLGATFMVTAEEANAESADGGYAQAAQLWTKMIAAEEPTVPAAMRAQIFAPAKAAEAEMQNRAAWVDLSTPPALRSLFHSLTRTRDLVENADLSDKRFRPLVQRMLAVDSALGRVLAAPFQVQVDAKDFSDGDKQELFDELMQALRKAGLKAEAKPPVSVDKRLLMVTAARGKTKPPEPDPHHPRLKLAKDARSCAVGLSAVLTENEKTLLKADLGARGVFAGEETCKSGPVQVATERAPLKLLDAAMNLK